MKLGISQKTLAQRAGVQQSTISRLERSNRLANAHALSRIARVLGVPVATLINEGNPTEIDSSPKRGGAEMAHEPDGRSEVSNELLFETLKAIQSKLSQHDLDFMEIKSRLGGMESQYANLSNRFDRLDERVRRIEARLDLIDA